MQNIYPGIVVHVRMYNYMYIVTQYLFQITLYLLKLQIIQDKHRQELEDCKTVIVHLC